MDVCRENIQELPTESNDEYKKFPHIGLHLEEVVSKLNDIDNCTAEKYSSVRFYIYCTKLPKKVGYLKKKIIEVDNNILEPTLEINYGLNSISFEIIPDPKSTDKIYYVVIKNVIL